MKRWYYDIIHHIDSQGRIYRGSANKDNTCIKKWQLVDTSMWNMIYLEACPHRKLLQIWPTEIVILSENDIALFVQCRYFPKVCLKVQTCSS